ncbi:FUSC family protein, partial [Winslowiella iniecta]
MLAWLAFQILRPSSDKRKSRRHIRALRREFLDQLSRHPRLSESRFESQIYHRISQLSTSRDQTARVWLLRWGVVLLNCSHIVWQLRTWQSDSATLTAMRDASLRGLQRIISERGVQHRFLDETLAELQQMMDALQTQQTEDAGELAGIIWRLWCSLSQLKQALPDNAGQLRSAGIL